MHSAAASQRFRQLVIISLSLSNYKWSRPPRAPIRLPKARRCSRVIRQAGLGKIAHYAAIAAALSFLSGKNKAGKRAPANAIAQRDVHGAGRPRNARPGACALPLSFALGCAKFRAER